MKQVGIVARLIAVVAVLVMAAMVVSGCGDDNGSSNGGSSTNADGSKQYSDDESLGEAKKVVVDSDQDFDAEQQEVVNTITKFGDATADKDYKTLCNELLSKEASQIGGDCERTFSQTGEALKDFKLTIKSVKVDGKNATADVAVTSNVSPDPQQQNLSLVKEGGDWKIQILGQ